MSISSSRFRAFALLSTIAVTLVAATDSGAAPAPPGPGQGRYDVVCPCASSGVVLPVAAATEAAPPAGSIAGAFSVSQGGSAVYAMSLAVPPGRAGMTPSLSIAYDSSGGDGTLGVGVSLRGFSSITRCASTIAQDHHIRGVKYDALDALCLDGLRLVEVPVTNQAHPIRGYHFSYQASLASTRPLLQTITECAADDLAQCKPPTRLAWSSSADSGFAESKTGYDVSHDRRFQWVMADVNGDPNFVALQQLQKDASMVHCELVSSNDSGLAFRIEFILSKGC